MRMPTSSSSEAAGNLFNWKDVLIAVAWTGLVTGLLEGAGMLGLKALHLLPWRLTIAGVTAENLYFAPLFNLLWFGAIGAAAKILAGPIAPGQPLPVLLELTSGKPDE